MVSRIYTPVFYTKPVTLKLTNIKDGDTTYSDTTIVFDYKQKTDMNSDQVMTANAVNQYTSNQYQKKNEMLDLLHPVGSMYWTTEDITQSELEQKFGGDWIQLQTNITTTTGISGTIKCFIRT